MYKWIAAESELIVDNSSADSANSWPTKAIFDYRIHLYKIWPFEECQRIGSNLLGLPLG